MGRTPSLRQLYVAVRGLQPDRAERRPWTWADVEKDIKTRECLCCGKPGHYQQTVLARVKAYGVSPIYVEDGYVRDGHHRVLAAIRLGILDVPTETQDDSVTRWLRDHGYVSWSDRTTGDVSGAQ